MGLLVLLPTLPPSPVKAGEHRAPPPETITIDTLQHLYEPVLFDHAMHAENYTCSRCHHHTTGDGVEDARCGRCHTGSAGSANVSCRHCHPTRPQIAASQVENGIPLYHIDKPGMLGALHLKCVGCHRLDGGPTGCRDCHGFTPAGRKRFAVTKP